MELNDAEKQAIFSTAGKLQVEYAEAAARARKFNTSVECVASKVFAGKQNESMKATLKKDLTREVVVAELEQIKTKLKSYDEANYPEIIAAKKQLVELLTAISEFTWSGKTQTVNGIEIKTFSDVVRAYQGVRAKVEVALATAKKTSKSE